MSDPPVLPLPPKEATPPNESNHQDLLLGYAYGAQVCGAHLDRSLRRLCRVASIGTGNSDQPGAVSGRAPFLWLDTPGGWLPTEELISERLAVAWLLDTHKDPDGWRLRLAEAFDFVFTAQLDPLITLHDRGIPAGWLPLAAPGDLVPPLHPFGGRSYDVGFVGVALPGTPRAALLEVLRRHFRMPPLAYYSPAEMMNLYSNCRTVVNLPAADDLNMRAFEAPASGSFLVTGPMRGLDQILPPDLYQTVEGDTPSHWVAALDRVLSEADIEARALRARNIILQEHTYDNRAQHVLENLAQISKRPRAPATRQRALAHALAHRGTPIQIWQLDKLPPMERVSFLPTAGMWWTGRHLPQSLRNLYARYLMPVMHRRSPKR